MKKWYRQRTTWTALAGIAGALAGMVTGVVDPVSGVQTIFGGLGFIFLRQSR